MGQRWRRSVLGLIHSRYVLYMLEQTIPRDRNHHTYQLTMLDSYDMVS